MIIGVDFDNTLVRFDHLFHAAAVERKLLPASASVSKEKIRNVLRAQGREDAWTALQGYVYGVSIAHAPMFAGAREFFESCKARSIPIFVISHKTKTPYRGGDYDLHGAARAWLKANGFVRDGLMLDGDVFFELTKADKLQRIALQRCTYFIDDLPEFLAEPDFPSTVKRILFDPEGTQVAEKRFPRATSWAEISRLILGTHGKE